MENGNGLSIADIASIGRGNNGFFGGGDGTGIMAILFLIVLMAGGGGFGFNNAIGYQNLATQNDVQRGFDALNLGNQSRDILTAVNNGTAQSVAATNQVFHDLVGYVGDKYAELDRDVLGVSAGIQQSIANQNQCCCDTKMLIQGTAAQNRYDALQNTNSVIANMNNGFNDLKATLAQNKIEELQGKVQRLELAQAVAGVVRYPNSMSYDAGRSPFCNCGGCGCMA